MWKVGDEEAAVVVVALGFVDALDLLDLYHEAAKLGARVAALQGNRPVLVDVLTELYTQNPERPILLVGYNRAGVGASRSWLKRVGGHWLRANPEAQVVVSTQLVTILDERSIVDAIVAGHKPVTGREAGMWNPTWGEPPAHRAHVLICQGPRCMAQGAQRVADGLYHELQTQGVAQDCLITLTGCLYPCNEAPVVCVQPFTTWLHADPAALADTARQIHDLMSSEPARSPVQN